MRGIQDARKRKHHHTFSRAIHDMVSTLSSGVEVLGSDAEVGRRRRYPKLGSEIHAVVVMSTKARHRIRLDSQSLWEGRFWSVGRTSIGAI